MRYIKLEKYFSQRVTASINTLRVLLGGSDKARQELISRGFKSEDGVTYIKDEQEASEEETYIKDEQEASEEETIVSSYKIDESQEGIKHPIIVTSYLIGSEVNPVIWKSLMDYKDAIKGNLVIIAHRYLNPTNLQQSIRKIEGSDYLSPLVLPYLSWEDFEIYNHHIAASVQINCNTLNPLLPARKFCYKNMVLGHPMQSLDVVPTVSGEESKVIWSTGTISNIDPASNLRSKVASYHHKFGWVTVEPSGWSRNIHLTKSGNFSDLGLTYQDGGFISLESTYKSIVLGDYHFGQTCPHTLAWAKDIINYLKPEQVVLHDFIDASTVNPHAKAYERSLFFDGSLEVEIFSACQELILLDKEVYPSKLSLVKSNHNDMVSRYFNSNKVEDMSRGNQLMLKRWLIADKQPEQILVDWVREITNGQVEINILEDKDNQDKINLTQHGDVGANGSKASLSQLFNLGMRCVVGHSHSPGILGGCHQVGALSKLKLGYNDKGASDWKNSLATVNKFNKVQHLIRF